MKIKAWAVASENSFVGAYKHQTEAMAVVRSQYDFVSSLESKNMPQAKLFEKYLQIYPCEINILKREI